MEPIFCCQLTTKNNNAELEQLEQQQQQQAAAAQQQQHLCSSLWEGLHVLLENECLKRCNQPVAPVNQTSPLLISPVNI